MSENEAFDTKSLDEIKDLLKEYQPEVTPASAEEGTAMDVPQPEQPDEPKKAPGYELFTTLQDLVHILAVVTVVFVFFFRLVGVDGSSMYPTLVNRDYLILESNFLYHDVQIGDVVVMNVDVDWIEGPIVKRVIAKAGQTVDIDFDAGIVYVDGTALDEPYTFEPTYESNGAFGMEYPLTVPDDCLFVMGDNRNNSADSRYVDIGCVAESRILGKVLLVLLPGQGTDEYGEVTGGRELGRIGAIQYE